MKNFNSLLLIILCVSLFSCGSNNGNKKTDFSLKIDGNKTEFKRNEFLKASVLNEKKRKIESVEFLFGGKVIPEKNSSTEISINLAEQRLGNQVLQAIITSEGQTDTISRTIKILNDTPPKVYTFEIVNSYPHDMTSYTQGLEFYKGILYEGTGQRGESKLRKVNLETGEVIQETELSSEYFGEGITILNGKIYQLTWQMGQGFIYDLEDFEKIGTFAYNQSKEGWGLCNDGKKIYKSDGTEKIWILNAETLAEESYIQPTHHRSISSKLNELEWVDGKIYANTYQKDGVAIINPQNGAIEGLINFSGLRDEVTQHDELDVLNGIAYNPETRKLYVTGKNWDKIFEVKIVEQ